MAVINTHTAIQGLIVGASQGIGLGIVQQLLQRPNVVKLYATYRDRQTATELWALAEIHGDRLTLLPVDICDETQIAKTLQTIQQLTPQLHLVMYCVGLLHRTDLQPEKNLAQLNLEQLTTYFQVNAVGAALLAKHSLPLLKHPEPSVFAAISAKVGSIGDNYLGGWYGYRASKAALNMLMHTAAIEYGRKSPHTIVVTLHPGTTDTQLSQPFQRHVPPEKLFSVERTATQLLQVIAQLTSSDSGYFFNWDGERLPW